MKKYKQLSQKPLYIMLIPAILLVFIYSYIPMAGIVIAFQQFIPAKGLFGNQEWIGFGNFTYAISLPNTFKVIGNTVFIASMKIIAGLVVPIMLALLLNEVRINSIKKSVQTLIYLPYFFSWVILAGIFVDVLSPNHGIVNQLMGYIGLGKVFFLGDPKIFPYLLVVTDIWKNAGFNTVIFLAALTSINPSLYESAVIDGAGRMKQTRYITLPGMASIIILIATLSIGSILNAGFEQVFNLYSPVVYQTGDIIDTFIYRLGLVNAQFGLATAVGLFKSIISFIFISSSYLIAYKVANYRIF